MNLELSFTTHRLRITHATPALSPELVRGWVAVCTTLLAALPLTRATFVQQAAGVYDYRAVHQDGRVWKQDVTFQAMPDPDPYMSFSVGVPGWRLSEFAALRPFRDAAVNSRNVLAATSILLQPW